MTNPSVSQSGCSPTDTSLERWVASSEGTAAALKALRAEVEAAHAHVQQAQRIAYGALKSERRMFWTQLALNKAQSILIKQLVHRLKDVPRA